METYQFLYLRTGFGGIGSIYVIYMYIHIYYMYNICMYVHFRRDTYIM